LLFDMLIHCISFKRGQMRRKETDYDAHHTGKEIGYQIKNYSMHRHMSSFFT